jgi:hypothetical protein
MMYFLYSSNSQRGLGYRQICLSELLYELELDSGSFRVAGRFACGRASRASRQVRQRAQNRLNVVGQVAQETYNNTSPSALGIKYQTLNPRYPRATFPRHCSGRLCLVPHRLFLSFTYGRGTRAALEQRDTLLAR